MKIADKPLSTFMPSAPMGSGGPSPVVEMLQQLLNATLGCDLACDGRLGPRTRAALGQARQELGWPDVAGAVDRGGGMPRVGSPSGGGSAIDLERAMLAALGLPPDLRTGGGGPSPSTGPRRPFDPGHEAGSAPPGVSGPGTAAVGSGRDPVWRRAATVPGPRVPGSPEAPAETPDDRAPAAPEGVPPPPPPPGADRVSAGARQIIDRDLRGLSARDRAAFHTIDRANQQTESGGRARYSTLRTTAGFPASYGRGQLVVREQLTELGRMSESDLSSLGTSRAEVGRMRERGEAAEGWHHLLNGRSRRSDRLAARTPLSAEERTEARRLAQSGDYAALESRFGQRFHESTGLPASEIRRMAETQRLRDPALRHEFRDAFRSIHGREFDPDHRRGSEMAAAAERVVQNHPELRGLQERLGNTSLGHYLGAGDTAEDVNGWYGRAASTTVGRERFDQVMANVDAVTTHQRHMRNFRRARRIVDTAGVTGDERTRLIGRLSRQFHGAPGAMRDAFFEDRDLSRPRYHSPQALRAGLDRWFQNERRARSDRNFTRNYELVTRQTRPPSVMTA